MVEFQETAGWHPREKRVLKMPLRPALIAECFRNCLKLIGKEVPANDFATATPTSGGGGGGRWLVGANKCQFSGLLKKLVKLTNCTLASSIFFVIWRSTKTTPFPAGQFATDD